MEPGVGGQMTDLAVSPHDPSRVLVSGDMLGVALSLDGGDTWAPTFGFKSWEIAAITWHPTDPNIVWAGTMSGPYLSLDGGLHWQEMREGFVEISDTGYSAPIERVLFTPGNEDRLLAFGGSMRNWSGRHNPPWGDIWLSEDAGQTWSWLVALTAEGATDYRSLKGVNIAAAAYAAGSDSRIYAGTRGGGVMVSEDGGVSWAVRSEGLPTPNVRNLVVHPTDPDTVWVTVYRKKGVAGGVYRSEDAGVTWTDVSNGLDQNPKARYRALIVCPQEPDRLYTACWRGTDLDWAIFRSDDGGDNWRFTIEHEIPTPYPPDGFKQLAVDPNDSERIFAVGNTSILRTLDGGETWKLLNAEQVGDAWRGTGYSGLVSTRFTFDPHRQGHAILQAMDMGRVWRTTDGGRTWMYHASGAPYNKTVWYGGRDASFAGDRRIYASFGQHGYFSGLGRSVDGGETWSGMAGIDFGLPEIGEASHSNGIYARPDEPLHVWAIIGGLLYSSSDGGDSWTQLPDFEGAMWIAGDPNRPERFFVSGRNNLWLSEDGGESFASLAAPVVSGRMTVDTLSRLYIAGWRHHRWPEAERGLWRFDGEDWTCLKEDPFIADVAVDPTDPQRVAIATNDHPYHDHSRDSGVWLSADGGETWRQANRGLPMTRGEVIAIDPHDPQRLVFGSFGAGFFEARWP